MYQFEKLAKNLEKKPPEEHKTEINRPHLLDLEMNGTNW